MSGKRRVMCIVLAAYCIIALGADALAEDLEWQRIGEDNLNLSSVLVDSNEPRLIFVGSRGRILKTIDGGKNWREVFSCAGAHKLINSLTFALGDRNFICAATGNGLFYSFNQGKDWKRVFKGKNILENDCQVSAVSPSVIYLGTKGGLFISKDRGRSWFRESSDLGRGNILAIALCSSEPGLAYVASTKGVFKSTDAGKSWERVFSSLIPENIQEERGEEPQGEAYIIRHISIDPNNGNNLYLATSRGVYRSQDRAKTWEAISVYGLLTKDIKYLFVSSKSEIYAVCDSGVFRYRDQRWQEISFWLQADHPHSLAEDREGNLYLAAESGLFKTKKINFSAATDNNPLSLYSRNEPSIKEIQQAAIRYAEVEPEKITNWRKRASRKALLPKISLGAERNVTDLWHWEGGSTTKAEDDILRKGKDVIEWDISLSWDLGELIWNGDQTSIDVRSRLMVELRDDILNEVTRLYFERLRLKVEIDNLSITESKKRTEKQIRMQELSALIDALTGGYFSCYSK